MDENKILYAISVEDVMNVSEEVNIPFDEKDLLFIEDKIGDFMGSKWSEAIEYALQELKGGK
ncbi:MAG: hypothetical protein COY75_05345 [Nitrospirae bacterium CG_4_10_14_0_8_um_filter_41_23]|jgi:hypothetical protein|nr:MAG: hypothetical protein COV68_07590 [Nitrospirae bacterium CG11_big_fil_rev_8_21_14_0_20_41_14]PIV44800.1 MAG: hypothetical protein COS27_00340 [Nitrospirae bacterium CG02_land_8_20_14_3_00_41_53]PIW87003.1 MAG: hypothetical protein COZ94_07430 [Nitrospirae bacterium CG_4_8_14_3_um_filter_41_47]PIY86980.1 MAG: hypothetical protein COY75_05345 [Nitrospirae bacterium CG_4_10_14_0_8_um_filter_41_23]PJA79955.1 MAG: hypothetical protein CO148_05360 [Nitrospirae bacterium CG_4_9_14_3_um_filter_4